MGAEKNLKVISKSIIDSKSEIWGFCQSYVISNHFTIMITKIKKILFTIDHDCEVSGTKNSVNRAAKRQMLPKR